MSSEFTGGHNGYYRTGLLSKFDQLGTRAYGARTITTTHVF